MPHVHVHLHDDFEETKHPRGRGGKFARKGAAAAKGGAKRLTQIAISAAGNFSHEDFKILQQNLHAPNSAPRKSLGQKVLSIAKTLPSLLKGHLKEEKEKAVHAAGALRAMATGKGQRQNNSKAFVNSVLAFLCQPVLWLRTVIRPAQ
jgi:hypothetical protein